MSRWGEDHRKDKVHVSTVTDPTLPFFKGLATPLITPSLVALPGPEWRLISNLLLLFLLMLLLLPLLAIAGWSWSWS